MPYVIPRLHEMCMCLPVWCRLYKICTPHSIAVVIVHVFCALATICELSLPCHSCFSSNKYNFFSSIVDLDQATLAHSKALQAVVCMLPVISVGWTSTHILFHHVSCLPQTQLHGVVYPFQLYAVARFANCFESRGSKTPVSRCHRNLYAVPYTLFLLDLLQALQF